MANWLFDLLGDYFFVCKRGYESKFLAIRGGAMGKKKVDNRIDGMSVPNHNIRLDWALEDGSETIEELYPVLQMKVPECKGSGSAIGYAFFDHSYKSSGIYGKSEPPTWMDPVIFVEMADKSEEVRALARRCVKKNFAADADMRKMEGILQGLFEEQYLVYMFDKFEACRGLLAEWLLAHYDYLNIKGAGVLPSRKERTKTLESRRLTRLENKGEN
jgi:hypothetical protein